MKKYLFVLLVVSLVLGLGSVARAEFSWQTYPMLGHYRSHDGNVDLITGPQPFQGDGVTPYYDESGHVVLGPVLPHWSDDQDGLYQVGAPGVTLFNYNPNVYKQDTSGNWHWTDPKTTIYSASGVNLDVGNSYTVSMQFDFLGFNGYPAYTLLVGSESFVADESFTFGTPLGLTELWLEDAGPWRYTETWTDVTDPEHQIALTGSVSFQVQPVPLPGVLWLFGPGLAGLVALRRRFMG